MGFIFNNGGQGGGGSGTVTSVNVVGGVTGLTTTGGPVTTAGTITLGGFLNIESGGTAANTAVQALNNLLPAQALLSGYYLKTDGTNASWQPMGLNGETDATTDADFPLMGVQPSDSYDTITASYLTGVFYNPGDQAIRFGSDDPNHPGMFEVAAGYMSQNVYVGAGSPGSEYSGGINNVAVGYSSMPSVTFGTDNTMVGASTGLNITTGENNTLIGSGAGGSMLAQSSNNTILGCYSPPSLEINGYIAIADGLGRLSYSDDGGTVTIFSNRSSSAIPLTFPTAIGGQGQVLTALGSGLTGWSDPAASGVTTFSGGDTGLTPATPTAGTVTLGGALLAGYGGTGLTTYTPGAMLFASGATALSPLEPGTDGYVLAMQGGVPTWVSAGGGGLIGITQGVSPFRTALGSGAMDSFTTGTYNTGVGYNAGTALTSGSYNTVFGAQALQAATGTNNNTVLGALAMASASTGSSNTAVGYSALRNVGIGGNNVAVGVNAGINATGGSNTFLGGQAGGSATTIANAVFVGFQSGGVSQAGANGAVGVGHSSLGTLTTGASNTAIGYQAGSTITTGSRNTVLGYQAGTDVVSGNNNTLLGHTAGLNVTSSNNLFLGALSGSAVTTGGNNTFIGPYVGAATTASTVVIADGAGLVSYLDDGTNLTLYSHRATTPIPMRLPVAQGTSGQVLTNDGAGNTFWSAGGGGGSGTVTSINVDGGATGLTASGGPVTTAGTITLGGLLNIASGGTGGTTAQEARTNLLPAQAGNASKALVTDGTDVSWATIEGSGTVGPGVEWNLAFYPADGTEVQGTPCAAYYEDQLDNKYLVIGDSGDIAQKGRVVMSSNGNEIRFGAPPELTTDYELFLPKTVGTALQVLATDGDGQLIWVNQGSGGGTVTSVNVAGGTTGMTFTGGPITHSGTITLGGTLAIANGGTGATSAGAALNNLLPSQTGNANKVLTTDGTNAAWVTPSGGGSTGVVVPAMNYGLGGPAVVGLTGEIEQGRGFYNLQNNAPPAGVNANCAAGIVQPVYDTDGVTVKQILYVIQNADGQINFFSVNGSDQASITFTFTPNVLGAGGQTKTGLGLVRVNDNTFYVYGAGSGPSGNLGGVKILNTGTSWIVTTLSDSGIATVGPELQTVVYDVNLKHIHYYWGADGLFCCTYNPSNDTWTPSKRVTTGGAGGQLTVVRQGSADYILAPSASETTLWASYININSDVSAVYTFLNALPYKGWAMDWSEEAQCLIIVMPWAKDELTLTTPNRSMAIGLRPLGNRMVTVIPMVNITDEAPTANAAYRCAPLMQRKKSGCFWYGWINSSRILKLTAFYVDVNTGGQPTIYTQGTTQPWWGQNTFGVGAFPALVAPNGRANMLYFGNPTETGMGKPYFVTYQPPNITPNNVAGVFLGSNKAQISGIVTKPAWGLTPGQVYGVKGVDFTPYYQYVPLDIYSVQAGKALSATQMLVG